MRSLTARPAQLADHSSLSDLIDASGLFPSDLLPNMMASYLGGETTEEIWLTIDDPRPCAIAYCALERMTAGTWNLRLLAVHPERQGRGYGTALIDDIEARLRGQDARILLVETSGLADFSRARQFYIGCGFDQEACIRDFYEPGNDKIVFRKDLISA